MISLSRKYVIVASALLLCSAGSYWFARIPGFQPQKSYPTGVGPLDLVVCDLNGDGVADIATANRDGFSLSLFLGNGDGSFLRLPDIGTIAGPISLDAGDVNADGFMDLIVGLCSHECAGGALILFSGRGTGDLTAGEPIYTDGVPYNVTLVDLDADNDLDVVASDYPQNRLLLLFNENGDFSPNVESLATGANPIALTVADLNGDTLPDLISSDHNDGGSTIYLTDGNGGYDDSVNYPTATLPYSITVADLDRDGNLDLIAGHSSVHGPISVHRGNGDGTFTFYTEFETGERVVFVTAFDVNDDRLVDIIACQSASREAHIYLGEPSGGIRTAPILVSVDSIVYAMAVADVNRDWYMDFIAVDYENSVLNVTLGQEVSD